MEERQTNTDLFLQDRLAELRLRYQDRPFREVMFSLITREFPGRIAVVSSFGTESAVLLHAVSKVDNRIPVIFIDTGKHFAETLLYRDRLISKLGFIDLRVTQPASAALLSEDPDGLLWTKNGNICCHLRKTVPLLRALNGFDCWITGRKQSQTEDRRKLQLFEIQDGRIKYNPLYAWERNEVFAYAYKHELEPHPLYSLGFTSVGCSVCTSPVESNADPRSGRWVGQEKSECGIHFENGKGLSKSGR